MRRTIKGLGSAFYLPHEERFVQSLLRGDSPTRYQEVEVLHALKVEFGGCLLPDIRDAERPPEQMELG